jgi:hypothetical protein
VSGVVIGSVVTGVLVAAAAVTAIVLSPMVYNNTPQTPHDQAAPPAAVSTHAPDTSTAPSPTPTIPPALPGIPPVDSASASSSDAPVTVLPDSATAPPVTGSPAPPAAPLIGEASVSPAGVLTLSGTGEPGNTVTATAQPIGGGGGGTARFAVVPSGIEVGNTTVGSSGSWILTTDLSDILPNGTYTFSVVQSGPAGDSAPATTDPIKLSVAPVAPAAPTVNSPDEDSSPIQVGPSLRVQGTAVPGNLVSATLTRVNGEATVSANAPVAATGEWQLELDITRLPNGPYTLSVTQTHGELVSDAKTVNLVLAVPPAKPAAPVISTVDTGSVDGGPGTDGLFYPIVRGSAEAGATVTVSGAGGEPLATAIADASGAWATVPITSIQPAQAITIMATQQVGEQSSDTATSNPFSLHTPTITDPINCAAVLYARNISVSIDGVPGASVQVALDDGEPVSTQVAADGAAKAALTLPHAILQNHRLIARYVDPADTTRTGPISLPVNFFVLISLLDSQQAQ